MRKKLIAANWKMYKTVNEASEYVSRFLPLVQNIFDRDIVLCVPFTLLYIMSNMLEGTNVKLGAQDMYFEDEGAYTGEISPIMLKDIGCSYVILGHSERRKYFGETDEIVNKKLLSALKHGLIPIVCIGETLEERESGKTFEVLEKQVKYSLANLSTIDAEKIVIAYEPVWAIGTGKNATPQQAQQAQEFIRKKYAEIYGSLCAEKVRILYGGSIKPENFKEIVSQKDVDGGLVGGASLDPENFYKIVVC